MDDLRIVLLIAGIVVVVVIVVVVIAYVRHARRRAVVREEELELGSLDSREDWEIVPIDRTSHESGEARDGTDTEGHVDGLGGMFAPHRDTSDAEPSVDLDILAGLRATYESTIDGTEDESIAPEPTEHRAATRPVPAVDAGRPPAAPAAEPSLAVDMTRPLIYLTLVAKQERLSGRMVKESLEEEGFRPGLMRLYYWRNDAESSVVFGVANMVEPGLLDPGELPGMETPGLVTFMSVPQDAATAFRILNAMVAVSRRLARRIDATLCDETRSTLTAQAENHLREKIADTLRQDRIRD